MITYKHVIKWLHQHVIKWSRDYNSMWLYVQYEQALDYISTQSYDEVNKMFHQIYSTRDPFEQLHSMKYV